MVYAQPPGQWLRGAASGGTVEEENQETKKPGNIRQRVHRQTMILFPAFLDS